MATVILIIIYIGYIGLGIPDSLLGSAWPAIYPDLSLPVSYASGITIVTSIGTIVSSFFSARIINRFGTAKVATVSTAMTAAALLGFSFSQNMMWMCLWSMPLGLGAGSVDAALNNYVAMHYKANHMSFLHCFYGVGVAISPYLMSLALSQENNWRQGYRIMFVFQLAIALIIIAFLPMWKKLDNQRLSESPKTLTVKQIFSTKGVKPVFGVFIFSCSIEAICCVWGSTFLVESKGLSPEKGAKIITIYFIGLALGRFVSGLVSKKISPMQIMFVGQVILLTAILLMFSSSVSICTLGLFLIGFGNGPVYPNMTHLTPITFGKDVSQSIIGMQMTLTYIAIMVTPLVFGMLAQYIGAFLAPYFQIILFAGMMTSYAVFIPTLKSKDLS